jgi:hypothetical protein
MPEMSVEARMAAYGLRLPPEEMLKLAELVVDMERAAIAVRSVERSYAEEPAPLVPAVALCGRAGEGS